MAISARTAILTLVLLSLALGVVAALWRYSRKRASDLAVHRMHDQARRERQQELLDRAQREARKCTYTSEVCDKLSFLAHEASDSMGTGLKLLEAGKPYAPTCPIEGGEPGCQSYVELTERLLFEQRAMLPPSAFGLMQDIRTASVAFEAAARQLSEEPGGPRRRRELERLRARFELANALYDGLVAEVKDFLDGFARAS